ncbi:hypothetical protein D3C78_1130970 [compost metagenome]
MGDRVGPQIVVLALARRARNVEHLLADALAIRRSQCREVAAHQAAVEAVGDEALAVQLDDEDVEIVLQVTLVVGIDGVQGRLWPAGHVLGGLVEQLQRLAGFRAGRVVANRQDVITDPLEETVFAGDHTAQAPVGKGVLDLFDLRFLAGLGQPHQLVTRLSADRHADVLAD